MLGVAAVSFAAIFTKLSTAPSLAIAFYRMLFTALLLLPFTLTGSRGEFRTIGGRDLSLALLSGVFLALHFAVWNISLRYTSVASSTVLVTMQPLFVVGLGVVLFREKLSLQAIAGAAVTLVGSIIIGAGDFQLGGLALRGDLLAFSGALFFAVYVLIGRSLRARLSVLPYVTLVYGAASLVLLLLMAVARTPLYPYHALDWLLFLALAVIPTILGHTVFNWALRYVKAAVVSVSVLGEPVGATILAILVLGEKPGLAQLAGGLVIISGLALFITAAGSRDNSSGTGILRIQANARPCTPHSSAQAELSAFSP
jgi:drug/metabolite transporter (DMT)-like permease